MNKIKFVLVICLMILGLLIFSHSNYLDLTGTKQQDKPDYLVDTYREYDLDLDNKKEVIYFRTNEVAFGDWTTEVFVNEVVKPALTVDGLLKNISVNDISNNFRILELVISGGGKLINSHLYKYQNGKLIRIPIITSSQNQIWDIWSSGGTEFKDLNKDGVMEMFVYHRHYPPEAKRTVDVYKFNGGIFKKYREYEEAMEEVYF